MGRPKKVKVGTYRKGRAPEKKLRSKDGSAQVHISPTSAAIVFDGQSLDDWSDEELMQGRRRDKNGRFWVALPR